MVPDPGHWRTIFKVLRKKNAKIIFFPPIFIPELNTVKKTFKFTDFVLESKRYFA